MVSDAKRRCFDLHKLITNVVISPWAEAAAVEDIALWVTLKGFPAAAQKSALTGGDTPTLAEFREHRHVFSGRPKELEVTEPTDAIKDEIERFTEEISRLPIETCSMVV